MTNMNHAQEIQNPLRLLLVVDFTDCCRLSLQKSMDFFGHQKTEIIALHVIDQRSIQGCINDTQCTGDDFSKKMFVDAKARLQALLQADFPYDIVKSIVCKGVPYLEIKRNAKKFDVDIIIIFGCSMQGDTEDIFFGGTAEKVLRFTKRPVLYCPPNESAQAATSVD